ncbi:MAG: adenosylcobinamide-GDP ribazoletransferase [Clostridiales bacterium]|nr:adenosylcobinamide-GDP ribazoletransferase [Clostridiales bacterium]
MKLSIENKKYTLLILPLAGVVMGILMYTLCMLCMEYGYGQAFFALIGAAVPVLVTGGINLAGFMRTVEALKGGNSVEKRLEMLKENRVGIYSVIAIGAYYLLYAGGLVMVWKDRQLLLLGVGYVISVTLGGMGAVWFPQAKVKDGIYTFASNSEKRVFKIFLCLILTLCFGTCIVFSAIMGMLEALLCMWIWTYYYYMSKKRFGGVTVELTGYFIAICDLAVVLFVGVVGRAIL